jgi:hypothetical protein
VIAGQRRFQRLHDHAGVVGFQYPAARCIDVPRRVEGALNGRMRRYSGEGQIGRLPEIDRHVPEETGKQRRRRLVLGTRE